MLPSGGSLNKFSLVLVSLIVLTSAAPYEAFLHLKLSLHNADGGEQPNTADARIYLARVNGLKDSSLGTINTLICEIINSQVQSQEGEPITGIRVMENAYDGDILKLVRSISKALTTKHLLKTLLPKSNFAEIEVFPEAGQAVRFPAKITFDVDQFYVEGDPNPVVCSQMKQTRVMDDTWWTRLKNLLKDIGNNQA